MAVDVTGRDVRVRAFELIQEIQGGAPGAAAALADLTREAHEQGLAHVARIGMFGHAVHSWFTNSPSFEADADALVGEGRRSGDRIMLALGLSMRAAFGTGVAVADGDGPASARHDQDLAEAVVILETSSPGHDEALEMISARTATGIAFDMRSLWELGDEQYGAAAELADRAEAGVGETLLAAVMFNRVEAQVTWAARLRQLGDLRGLEGRWRAFASVECQSNRFAMPDAWRTELKALALLMAAIAGRDVAREARRRLESLEGPAGTGPENRRAFGLLSLAAALGDWSAGRPAAGAAARALAAVEPEAFPLLYDLALHLAAEIEAADGPGYGLQAARRQMQRQWSDRLRSLEAMRSNIAAQRMRVEIDRLSSENRRDALTGIGNRRALDQYVAELPRRRVERVAVLMVDVDGFKKVNDGHGHDAGDSVLARIASVLEGGIRPADLAVRLGGDEFLVVLADADRATAVERADHLLRQIGGHPWQQVSPGLRVGVSVGVASGPLGEFDGVRAAADRAVYRSKRAGGGVVR